MTRAEVMPMTASAWSRRIKPLLGEAVESIIAVGVELRQAKASLPHGEFSKLGGLLGMNPRTIQRYISISNNQAIANATHVSHLPPSWSTLYELSRLEPPKLTQEIKRGTITPQLERSEAKRLVIEANRSVPDYDDDSLAVSRRATTNGSRNGSTIETFNKVNDNIGWARWSWNPVTGCLHDCDYCYARDLAERFYPQKFAPTFLPERLSAPANTKVPKDDAPEWRRVFTCSMADLFGKWVPQEWIDAVFEQIVAAPQWEFLCLTKFPQRLAKLDWPKNVWAGTTVDRQARVSTAERSFSNVTAGVKWLSCEPLLEPLRFKSLEMFDWVVIGASTGSTHARPFAPPFDWVADLYQQARAAGCRVYLKHNLFGASEGRTPGMTAVREWPR